MNSLLNSKKQRRIYVTLAMNTHQSTNSATNKKHLKGMKGIDCGIDSPHIAVVCIDLENIFHSFKVECWKFLVQKNT